MGEAIAAFQTLLPFVLAGLVNVVAAKAIARGRFAWPVDGGRLWRDGRPLIGAHKTWVGVLGMPVLSIAALAAASGVARSGWLGRSWVPYAALAWWQVLLVGGWVGLLFTLLPLPASFLKRRLEPPEGEPPSPWARALSAVLDEVDSALGLSLALACVVAIPWRGWFMVLVMTVLLHALLKRLLRGLQVVTR